MFTTTANGRRELARLLLGRRSTRRHRRAVLPARVPAPALRRRRPRAGARVGDRAARSRASRTGSGTGRGGRRRAMRGGVPIPYVISPRGMLDAGSIAHHAWRKRVAYLGAERRHLAGAALLHAASDAEANTLAERVPSVPVAVLPNGVDGPGDMGPRSRELSSPAGLAARRAADRVPRPPAPDQAPRCARRRFRGGSGEPPDGATGRSPGPTRTATAAASSRCSLPWRQSVHWMGEVGEADKWALLAMPTPWSRARTRRASV